MASTSYFPLQAFETETECFSDEPEPRGDHLFMSIPYISCVSSKIQINK